MAIAIASNQQDRLHGLADRESGGFSPIQFSSSAVMLRVLLLAALFANSSGTSIAGTGADDTDAALKTECAANRTTVQEPVSINGQIETADGDELDLTGIFVFLCHGETGYPINRDTRMTIDKSMQFDFDGLIHARCDKTGRFTFADVPPGTYRLVAQSWPGLDDVPQTDGPSATHLRLHGVAERVIVDQDQPAQVTIRPLGTASVKLQNDPAENHCFVIISRGPLLGEPVLGPLVWGEEFVRGAIGATLMEEDYTTISGLPAGAQIHVGLFNYDNNPGIGGGTYTADDGATWTVPIYATWSNGRFDPPQRLLPLVEFLERQAEPLSHLIMLDEADNPWALARTVRENPKMTVDVDGFGAVPLVDLMAADSFVRLRKHHRARHR